MVLNLLYEQRALHGDVAAEKYSAASYHQHFLSNGPTALHGDVAAENYSVASYHSAFFVREADSGWS